MNTYLTIVTTALVITQIIRLTQNAVSLRRQNKVIKEQLIGISDLTESDLQTQREAYRMLHQWLKMKIEEEGAE